jgi:hypothetical protein
MECSGVKAYAEFNVTVERTMCPEKSKSSRWAQRRAIALRQAKNILAWFRINSSALHPIRDAQASNIVFL